MPSSIALFNAFQFVNSGKKTAEDPIFHQQKACRGCGDSIILLISKIIRSFVMILSVLYFCNCLKCRFFQKETNCVAKRIAHHTQRVVRKISGLQGVLSFLIQMPDTSKGSINSPKRFSLRQTAIALIVNAAQLVIFRVPHSTIGLRDRAGTTL